jgi:hypothetical protein
MAHVPLVAIDPRRRGFGKLIVAAIVTMIDAENTLDPADDATDRAADNRTDRPGPAVALVETMRRAAGNALRLGRSGGEDCKNRTDERNANFHEVPLCLIVRGVCPPIMAIRRPVPAFRGLHPAKLRSSRDTNDTDCRVPRHSADTQWSYDTGME